MEIPIFPLPLVFFPKVLVPLHIFEERYKLMVHRCIEDSSSFGIVFISAGSVENESNMRSVGVAARIVQYERLADGRFNIVVAGEQRFRIGRLLDSRPYWRAEIEFFEDDHENDNERQQAYVEVARRYRELLALAARQLEIPEDPAVLSYTVSSILDVDAESKQDLLEMTSTTGRLRTLVVHLKEAIHRMSLQIAANAVKRMNGKANGNGHFKPER